MTLPLPSSTMLAAVGYALGSLPDSAAISGDRRSAIRQYARLCGADTAASTSCPSAMLRALWNAADSDHARRVVIAINSNNRLVDDNDLPAPAPVPLDDAAARLRDALHAVMGAAPLDESRVRDIVTESVSGAMQTIETMVKQALDKSAPRVIEVRGLGEPRRIEGRVHAKFDLVLKLINAGIPVLLVGPAGSGKSTLAHQVSTALGLAFYYTSAVNSEYKLTGFRDAHGNYQGTPFQECYENGGLFCFDEVDASSANALLPVNNALSNGHLDLPKGMVAKHATWRIVATANTYGTGADRQYVGRNQLDAAFLDRWFPVVIDYDRDMERDIAGNDDWTRRVQQVRAGVANAKARHIVSPRASIFGAMALAAGVDQATVEESLLRRNLDSDTWSKIRG
jgi:MoxR-like ATPase